MKKIWSKEQKSLLLKMAEEATPTHEIARHFRCSEKAVNNLLYKLRKTLKPRPEDDLPQDKKDLVAYWKSEATRLGNALKEARIDKTATQILVERVLETAPVSYQPAPFKPARKVITKSSPQSAVLLFSDQHFGKVVSLKETLGCGQYNTEIFLRRLNQLEKSIFSIIRDHTTTEVPEIVIGMLGDMVEGSLMHSAEVGQHSTVFSQFYGCCHAIAQFLRRLATLAPLRIYTTVGNHGRWSSQKKMPSDGRFSNLDSFCYAHLEALTRDIPSISWNLSEQPFALFEVQGFQFHASHGDELKGFDRAIGLPAHSIGRRIAMTSQLFAKMGRPAVSYFCCGHLHRPFSLPTGSGEFLINGAFVGADTYAMQSAFTPVSPSQKFMLISPKHGRSATYDLQIGLGDDVPHTYELPDKFLCN